MRIGGIFPLFVEAGDMEVLGLAFGSAVFGSAVFGSAVFGSAVFGSAVFGSASVVPSSEANVFFTRTVVVLPVSFPFLSVTGTPDWSK